MKKQFTFVFLISASMLVAHHGNTAYDETARGLTRDFEQNFGKYESNVGTDIKKVAIRAAA